MGGGNIDTCAGAVVNYAYLHNARDGYIDNWSGLIRNEAFLVNDGHIYNPDGSYRIENSGAFENAGYIYNGGVVWNACGGAFYGGGGLSGEPVEYQPCDPGHALHLLIPRVLDAGSPPSPVLSKSDVGRLTAYLARAAKDLERYLSSPENDGAPAEARVEAFIADVHGLTAEGILPEYLGAALSGGPRRSSTSSRSLRPDRFVAPERDVSLPSVGGSCRRRGARHVPREEARPRVLGIPGDKGRARPGEIGGFKRTGREPSFLLSAPSSAEQRLHLRAS